MVACYGGHSVSVIRVERTGFGPRLFVLGRRVHEYQVGLALLGAFAVGSALGRIEPTPRGLVPLLVGVWLVVKDWRDLFPRTRDTSSWRIGIHRRAAPLRPARRTASVPRVAAVTTAALAIVNLGSALTPNAGFRTHLLLQLEPIGAIRLFHALAVPASLTLVVVAYYLGRRKRGAWWMAVALLAGLSAANLVKGLDVEEAALSLAGVGFLFWGRREFSARHDPLQFRSALWLVPLLAGSTFAVASTLVRLAALDASWGDVAREAGAALVWQPGPIAFGDELAHLPLALGLVGATSLMACVWLLLRPLAAPIRAHGPAAAGVVERAVRAHGVDTLAFFKLREDLEHVFDPTGRAFVSYRVESGVLICAGDPVGPPEAVPGAIVRAVGLAESHGLRFGAIGVSARTAELFELAGLRRMYLGDEAIVETTRFSLHGRAIRKVRQSVSRLEKAGYAFELTRHGSLRAEDLDALDEVSAAWLDGVPERGFAMTLDSLRGEHLRDTLVALARDADGRVRGFLHFVPAGERHAVSLSQMRRDRETPNGLTEFLVARSIEHLRSRGVEEMSLNFAVLARPLRAPRNAPEWVLGRLVALANPYFQLESLFRFNAKFEPRWEPRYLVFESLLGLPRVGLAAAWVEGQLPKLELRVRPTSAPAWSGTAAASARS